LLYHAGPLPDRQSDSWPVLDRLHKDLARLVEVVAGIEKAIDLRVVSRPLLDLVEVADVGNQRIVGFFFVVHRLTFDMVRSIIATASRVGLTPSPTCHTGQGGSRKGMRPHRQRNGFGFDAAQPD
jgi:hypothetical protein